MAYEKQTWQTGDVITQEKLNHMEQGIEDAYELPAVTETDNGKVLGVENGAWSLVNGGGGGALIVHKNHVYESEESEYWVLDKTWQEIYDAVMSTGALIVETEDGETGIRPVESVHFSPSANVYQVNDYETDSTTGYPKINGIS